MIDKIIIMIYSSIVVLIENFQTKNRLRFCDTGGKKFLFFKSQQIVSRNIEKLA